MIRLRQIWKRLMENVAWSVFPTGPYGLLDNCTAVFVICSPVNFNTTKVRLEMKHILNGGASCLRIIILESENNEGPEGPLGRQLELQWNRSRAEADKLESQSTGVPLLNGFNMTNWSSSDSEEQDIQAQFKMCILLKHNKQNVSGLLV